MSPGIRQREEFMANMRQIAVGAKLARRSTWTVTRQQSRETGIELTLRSGRRKIQVHVPVCISGPILWETGLRPVAPAPEQRELRLEAA